MIDWIKRKTALLSIAFGSVEKNALTQRSETLDKPVIQERRHTQGQLMDSLKHGDVTQEVLNLKWRTYKILRETEGLKTEIVDYDEDGMPITKTYKRNNKFGLDKIKLDSYDKYPLEMVIDNTPITINGTDTLDLISNKITGEMTFSVDDEGNNVAHHGKVANDDIFSFQKNETPISILRSNMLKFDIETFTKKLNIRIINNDERLLEFYITKYPDEFDRKTRFFISEIKKVMLNPIASDFINIDKVGFITYKSIGVSDFMEYQYDILSFDKIIEFNGYYVIKFKAKVIINGEDILEQHRIEELDKKYETKEKK